MRDSLGAFVLMFCLTIGLLIVLAYHLDKASCYDKALNYEANVINYSYWKKYCFVKMPNGKVVNMENYRDIQD